MATLRELKGRIGSVASSEKITGAMKMISSAKMHKAEGALKRLVPFRNQIETIMGNLLSADADFTSPLVESHLEVKRVSLVVLGSDEGLCGAYNTNIFKQLVARIDELRERYGLGVAVDVYPVGKKMLKAVTKIDRKGVDIVKDIAVTSKSEGRSVRDFMAALNDAYVSGATDRVEVIYVHYHSAGRQRLTDITFLPVNSADLGGDAAAKGASRPYLFEPDPQTIFSTVLPLYLLSTMQEIFAQNRASEQAARVMAMQSANDNAKKLLEQLQLEYNKLRQQSITSELLDIVGGQVRD
ncbi:MAG: ATP synthase F1 subunit gamma [Muribaculaceae bacterium]